VPLSDTLARRLAARALRQDGWLVNLVGRDSSEDDQLSFPGQLLFEPGDSVRNVLKFESGSIGTDASIGMVHMSVGRDAAGRIIETSTPDVTGFVNRSGDFWTGSFDEPGLLDIQTRLAQNTLSIDLTDAVSLTSVTGYLTVKKDYLERHRLRALVLPHRLRRARYRGVRPGDPLLQRECGQPLPPDRRRLLLRLVH
jgi:hypothetical protein